MLVALNGFGQTTPSYRDSNNHVLMNVITVKELMNELVLNERKKNHLYAIFYDQNADSNWINKSDVEYLMTLIDSKQGAYCLFWSYASMLPRGESTIGDHAIMMIEAFKYNREYPDESLICPKYGRKIRKELKKWWTAEKLK